MSATGLWRVAVATASAAVFLSATAGGAIALAPPLPFCTPEPGSPESVRHSNGYTYWFLTESLVQIWGETPDGLASFEILEHCPTAQRMELMLPHDGDVSGLRSHLSEMVNGEAAYTFAQIAAELTAMGGDARVVRVNYQSCACAGALGGEAD